MATWDDGYVTDVAYTANFYRELMPNWLALTSLLLGQRPPDIAAPFRYADIGCGNGLTTIAVAAMFPHADVWGFDFNPAHIEFARSLAARAGIDNVRFVESSFAELAAMDDGLLPSYDFMVAHGVLSWIAPENKRQLMSTIRKQLKAGGLVYLSYNVTAGWGAMLPVRALMYQLSVASSERTDQSATGVLDFVDRLKQAGALYFVTNPSVEQRLQEIRRQDPRYIAHEYLNRDWHPLSFAEIAGDMAEAKCRYIGSASLTENVDTVSVPAGMLPLLAETRDPLLRETLRDIGSGQTFRRDLYRKGVAQMPMAEQQTMLETLSLIRLGQPVPDEGITFATSIGRVVGRPEIYQPLIAMLDAGPLTIARIAATPGLSQLPLVEVMQAFILLIWGGYAHPMLPADLAQAAQAPARAVNQAIVRATANATDIPFLFAPTIGAAVAGDVLEILVVGQLLDGKPPQLDLLTTDVLALLGRSGRNVQKDGKAVTDPAEARQITSEAIRGVLERRVPLLRRLGVLEA